MKLSNQALGALMMALQKSLLEQSDIVPVLEDFTFTDTPNGLIVDNPPVVNTASTGYRTPEEEETETGAVFRAYIEDLNESS
jgi:hypothetical protein|tara:strand:+ start:36 stop:281 length:246 start_codon:yes stop_codon:yes gene_type:complete